ncbi:uncharacterized protein [Halyomorpha halys]|uniref:uncharacterized protein n=1 Tax=Halyomorpha halys TaxID=286706 RepID=UPI0006D4E731|nr:uncharacterized protein LOC106678194 [Halyomorpha halys]XP_014272069.1 uncharacterized protein LOC106678194 [Halyomorpha halys]
MALSVGSFTRISQKLSDTFLKVQNNSVTQVATITGNTRRSKSAVPGWYKRMSMGSNNAPSDMQYAGMSPSARFVTSSKNGALVKNTLKNNDIPKNYLMNQLTSQSRTISDMGKPRTAPRTRSLPRWKEDYSDRELDQFESTDFKQPMKCSSLTDNSLKAEDLEQTLTSSETEKNIGEGLEEIERALMSGIERALNPESNNDPSSFKRTLNINLNELDPVLSEAKKTLSMDINVVVSVKSPENKVNPEIGFQKLRGKESNSENRRYIQSTSNRTLHENIQPIETEEAESLNITDSEEAENFNITDREAAENLKFGSEQRLFSQKDITEEIGKVYEFLKANNGKKSILKNNNRDGSNIFVNYDAVKKLYLNALGCVKACEELKNNSTMPSSESEAEDSDVVNELERCFVTEDNTDTAVSYSQNPTISSGRQNNTFLSRALSDFMAVRMYASSSDCEKAKKLPCLQSSELSSAGKASADSKSVCDKLCMPCCKPARDPPRCFYPYHKAPCKKLKPPRPAFSECKQLFEMKQVQPCECVRPRATRCKKPEESATCEKR